MNQRLLDKLNKRKAEGTIRSLSHVQGSIDFFSNDYLGLSRISVQKKDSASHGSTGSRLISGNSFEAEKCEDFLTEFFQVEKALVFNSGYDANLGFFSSVLQRGDVILFDEEIHASVRDGIRLSHAKAYSFKHNDINDLLKKIDISANQVYVAVESLYSMSGTKAPLQQIAEICQEKGVSLIVDEAHAAGVFGENGKGLVNELGLERLVFARLVTFGKAYGAHGGAILGSSSLIQYLINFARSFIYTTAMPPESYSCITEMVQVKKGKEIDQLKQNIHLFRELFANEGIVSAIDSPIQIIQPSKLEFVAKIANGLQQAGFAVKPIFSPTVPEGKECIRICLHAFNSEQEIQSLYHMFRKLS